MGMRKKQAEELRKTAETWRVQVNKIYIPRSDSWYALTTSIMKKIEYSLPTTTISETTFNWIMAPILDAGLPAAGICRKMKHAFVYGPKLYQGLGLHHPYITQFISHIITTCTHMRKSTLTGHLLATSYEYLQLETGLSEPFKHSYQEIGKFTTSKSWLTNLWETCELHRISLNEEHPPSLIQS